VSTTINTVNLSNFIKMVDLNYATPNQTLTYTITVSNTGTTDAFNAFFYDTIPNGTVFIPNSLYVDNILYSGNPEFGVNVGTIASGAVKTILFSVKIL
ncbi:MAG: DUF11 domain-containing protein, partial [Clostridium sp.]